jgi:hypothetical protein
MTVTQIATVATQRFGEAPCMTPTKELGGVKDANVSTNGGRQKLTRTLVADLIFPLSCPASLISYVV